MQDVGHIPSMALMMFAQDRAYGFGDTYPDLEDLCGLLDDIYLLGLGPAFANCEFPDDTVGDAEGEFLHTVWPPEDGSFQVHYEGALQHIESDYILFCMPGAAFNLIDLESLQGLIAEHDSPDAVFLRPCELREEENIIAGCNAWSVKSPTQVPKVYAVRREVISHLRVLPWVTPTFAAWHFWLSFFQCGYGAMGGDGSLCQSKVAYSPQLDRHDLKYKYAKTIRIPSVGNFKSESSQKGRNKMGVALPL